MTTFYIFLALSVAFTVGMFAGIILANGSWHDEVERWNRPRK
jgi:hypothetical protein